MIGIMRLYIYQVFVHDMSWILLSDDTE